VNQPILLVLAFLLGAMISVYQPMNASVSRIVGSPLLANVVFYCIALAAASLLFILFSGVKPMARLRDVPPALFSAGAMSAVMVLGTIILLPRLGTRRLFLLQVAGQIIGAMLIGHYGLLGLPRDPLTLRKFGGGLVLLIGAILSLG